MKIILGGCKSGKSMELLKLFIKDGRSATYITDELTLKGVIDKINHIVKSDDVDFYNSRNKDIKTCVGVNCNSDYLGIVNSINTDSIYLDIRISEDFLDTFKTFCLLLERNYGFKVVLAHQKETNTNAGIEIIEFK